MNKVYKFALLLSAFMALFFVSCDDDFWELSKYNITYETAHGTAPDTIVLEYGTYLSESNLPDLEWSGYDFNGWYKKGDSSEELIESGKFKVTDNVTLVASWTENGSAKNVDWLSAVAGDKKITLSWTYPDEDFSNVAIYVSKTKGKYSAGKRVAFAQFTTQEFGSDLPDNWVFDELNDGSAPVNGTTYWFKVTSTNSSGETAKNPIELSCTPKASTSSSSGSTGSSSGGSSSNEDTGSVAILIQ